MLGVQDDDALEKTKDDQGASCNKAGRNALNANIAARRPFLDFVYSRAKTDGSRQYLMVSGEPMFDVSGRYTGYCGIGKDVTETIRANN